MDRKVAFGQRVRNLRLLGGFSQERLAEAARLHRTYVGAVERGERNVSLVNIWRLADALSVHPAALFAEADGARGNARRRLKDERTEGLGQVQKSGRKSR